MSKHDDVGTKRRVKVCIIGGGTLGLKAAHDLARDNHCDTQQILVIEALDRLGGRIRACQLELTGHKYDVGASWFHDSLTNRVLSDSRAWPDEYRFDVARDSYFIDGQPTVYIPEQSDPINVSDLKLENIKSDLYRSIELRFFDLIDTPDKPLQDICSEFKSQYAPFASQVAIDYAMRMARTSELFFGIPWHKISGKYSVMDNRSRDLFNAKGYDYVVNYLASSLAPNLVILNLPVRSIDHRKSKPIVIVTDAMLIECDYVIVTVPASVLQLEANHPYGLEWTPPLPSAVKQALQTVHFGALGKVIFEFDKACWDITRDLFVVLGRDRRNTLDILHELPPSFSYPLVAFNCAAYNPECSSLMLLTQSPLTEYLESHPHEAWTYFKPMLAKFFNGNVVPTPIATIVSDWSLNPWARGSYTALETGDDPLELIIRLLGEHDDMAIGMGVDDPRVRFAGEHTILDGAGCVHGAYMSGAREAEWILRDIKDKV